MCPRKLQEGKRNVGAGQNGFTNQTIQKFSITALKLKINTNKHTRAVSKEYYKTMSKGMDSELEMY